MSGQNDIVAIFAERFRHPFRPGRKPAFPASYNNDGLQIQYLKQGLERITAKVNKNTGLHVRGCRQIEQALERETGRDRGPCQRKRKRDDVWNDQVNIGVETGRQPRRGLQRRRRLPGIGVDHSNEKIAGRLGTMWGEYLKIRDECRTHTSDSKENS